MTDWVNFDLFKLELKTHAGLLKYNILPKAQAERLSSHPIEKERIHYNPIKNQ
jgi:hypothetical protein